MTIPLLELEGTAEEIQQRLTDFAGQRLSVTVRSAEKPFVTPVPPKVPQRTIEEKILERARQAPDEERTRIPGDLTDNLDRYVYGCPEK